MEEKLIRAVCGHPVLYDTGYIFYRDRNKKEQAWAQVSQEVELPLDACRRKWKGMRDVYIRERRKERESKRSGSAGGPVKRWRYSAGLSFLDPFIAPKETSGDVAAEGHDPDGEAAAGPSSAAAVIDGPLSASDGDGEGEGTAPAAVSETVEARPPIVTQRRKRRMGSQEVERGTLRERRIEDLLFLFLQRQPAPPPPPPPRSEEELYLLSLVPSLQRLSPQQREYVKFQIQKLIYETGYTTQNSDLLEQLG